MGNIANRMFIEFIYKIKSCIQENKQNKKHNKEQNKSDISMVTDSNQSTKKK